MPSLERGRNVREDVALQIAATITHLPDSALKVFQCGRLPILIHQPVHIFDRAGGPRGWSETLPHVSVVLSLQFSLCSVIEVLAGVRAGEGKENIVDKRDWRGRAF